jgi:hypothetical protein
MFQSILFHFKIYFIESYHYFIIVNYRILLLIFAQNYQEFLILYYNFHLFFDYYYLYDCSDSYSINSLYYYFYFENLTIIQYY